jgi:hypothetical protein
MTWGNHAILTVNCCFEQRAPWNACCVPATMSIALSEVGSCWERQTTRPCKAFLSTEIRFVSRHYLLAFGPADTAISSFSFAITMGNNGERDWGSWQSTHFGTLECCHGKLGSKANCKWPPMGLQSLGDGNPMESQRDHSRELAESSVKLIWKKHPSTISSLQVQPQSKIRESAGSSFQKWRN